MNYSNEIREAVVRKAATRAAPQWEFAREFGISKTTVQNWLRQHRNDGEGAMTERVKRPQDWIARMTKSEFANYASFYRNHNPD
jgi:transposase-like protein